MSGVITRKHFFLILATFGPATALRVLFSRRRVALADLVRL